MTEETSTYLGKIYEVSQKYPIIFFDGLCGLCHGFVKRAIESDSQKKLRFATLQSEEGKLITDRPGVKSDLSTVIALYKGEIYKKSDVLILMSEIIGGSWTPAKSLKILPQAWRDGVYEVIAKYRYQLGHQKDQCPAPPPDWKDWFVLD